MTAIISRFRGTFIALVVLALTAGAALAGGGPPPAAQPGLDTARAASGQDVPLGLGLVDEDGDETADPEEPAAEEESDDPGDEESEEPEATETEESSDAEGENCTDVDPANHGALVCWAAQNMPDAWAGTHGAWVSCVARLSNNGHVVEPEEGTEVEPIVWSEMTPEACDEAIAAAREAKAAEREAARAERAAAREAAKAERAGARQAAKAAKQHGHH